MDEFPLIEINVTNIGDASSDPQKRENITIMVFDGERYMGEANFTIGTIIDPAGDYAVAKLDMDPSASGYRTSFPCQVEGSWHRPYAGRYTSIRSAPIPKKFYNPTLRGPCRVSLPHSLRRGQLWYRW
jgi:hypothetical protein